jgi:fluoride exporter
MRLPLAVLAVAVGGAFGSVARYLISSWSIARFGAAFPWGTFAINVSGSFLIGVVFGLAAARTEMSPYLRVFLTTGILGGYTTFSAFAFETYTLGAEGAYLRGTAYALGSVVLGVIAAYAGIAAVRLTTAA